MHRTWVSGVMGMVMMLAACTAHPATTSTTTPQLTQPLDRSTADSGVANARHPDGTVPLTVDSEVVEHDMPPEDAGEGHDRVNDTSASVPDPSTAVEDSPAVGSGEAGTETPQPDETTTTTNAETTEGLDQIIDDVETLLIDLEAILGDLDADLVGVGDGLNMTEGDI